MFSHALRHGLLRSEYCITLQSIPYRPPQLRCVIFPSTYLPHLPSIPSDSYWASTCLAVLPDIPSLICDFCPSDQRFAIRLPSDSTSRWTPLPLAVSFPLSRHFTDLHRLDYTHAGRTKIKSTHCCVDFIYIPFQVVIFQFKLSFLHFSFPIAYWFVELLSNSFRILSKTLSILSDIWQFHPSILRLQIPG